MGGSKRSDTGKSGSTRPTTAGSARSAVRNLQRPQSAATFRGYCKRSDIAQRDVTVNRNNGSNLVQYIAFVGSIPVCAASFDGRGAYQKLSIPYEINEPHPVYQFSFAQNPSLTVLNAAELSSELSSMKATAF